MVKSSILPAPQYSILPLQSFPFRCCFAAILQPRFSSFHPISAALLYNNPPPTRLLSTPFSVPPPKRAGTPEEINRPSVNVTPSRGGWGVEREMREDELPLRDATPRSALLRWGVVMEENSAMMLGGADGSGD